MKSQPTQRQLNTIIVFDALSRNYTFLPALSGRRCTFGDRRSSIVGHQHLGAICWRMCASSLLMSFLHSRWALATLYGLALALPVSASAWLIWIEPTLLFGALALRRVTNR
jgi:hypothetical protein